MERISNEEKAKEIHATLGIYADAYYGAMEMAKWKDEQHAKEKQKLIDKAAEWIDSNVNHYVFENEYGETYIKYTFTEDFIKAMKGE